jgi:sorting nexin-4
MEDEVFDSITWETSSTAHRTSLPQEQHQRLEYDLLSATETDDPYSPKWEGFLVPSVRDPVKELPDTRDAYVSYLVSAKVSKKLCRGIDDA